jgi:DNA replication protein DnaC
VVFGADTSDRTYVAESLAKTWFLGGRRVLLASFPQIVNRLTESKERGTFNRTIKLLDRYEVILIDELIRWNHRVEERMALFAELLAHRSGRRSVVITSGLPFYLWQVNEKIERFVEGSIFTEIKRTCQANQIRSRRK